MNGNLLIEISDYLIQFLILEGFIKERSLPETNLFKRDFRSFNEREFQETVLQMNGQNICNLQSNDPNLSCNNYFNSITYLLDEKLPERNIN